MSENTIQELEKLLPPPITDHDKYRLCPVCLENIERVKYDDHSRGHGYEIIYLGKK